MSTGLKEVVLSFKIEVKACPFCGEWNLELQNSKDSDFVFVNCNNCFAMGPWENHPSEAIEKWNKRTEPQTEKANVNGGRL